ncbi:MAG: phenazine biosynthesis protein PhzF family [Bacteroidetes bacterium]|jgi:PhzF family phenazine biosynthesis protein|nr:phenazine biosynthesis protein PhzF family [Bacteroidota bacterium]
MSIPIFQVDAFTHELFKGNPAAVCVLNEQRDLAWMQEVAAEMNLSETAFLLPQRDGSFSIRWCTPTVEVDLCGHATLASSHVIFETGMVEPDAQIRFESRSGPLGARRSGHWIELDFPACPESAIEPPPELALALGIKPKYAGKNVDDYLVMVDSERIVREMRPDFARLKQSATKGRGVIVTAAADTPGFDFISRFFAPGVGIDEDPVTGSAHCCLGPFWMERLHKSEFTAYQASPRGGIVRVRVAGDRVVLGGEAVTVFKGELVE